MISLGDYADWDSHVREIDKGGTIIKIFHVDACKTAVGGGDDTIQ